jgi:acyl-coenzyme A thioesterase 7
MDFHTPIRNANVVSLYAWPTFTSDRSIEIEVAVFTEDVRSETQTLCNSSRFTFVSLDSRGSVVKLPQLVTITDDERRRFEQGKARYEARKEARGK